jgi:hypothetical protein
MTGRKKWFCSLDPVIGKEYITFGDKLRGKVISRGSVHVNKSFVLKNVAFVSNLHFNLPFVLELLKDDYEMHFKGAHLRFLMPRGILFVKFPLLVEFSVLILLALLDVC